MRRAGVEFGLNHILAYGQSLSSGWEGWPAPSTEPIPGCFMLGNSVHPCSEAAPRWEPIGTAELRPLHATVQDPWSGALLAPEDVALLPEGHGALGETVLHAALAQWHQHPGPDDPPLLASSCGVGGIGMEALSKGAEPERFNRLCDCARLARDVATASGRSYGITALLMLQGENNNWALPGSTPDRETYKALLRQFAADFRNDIVAGIAHQTSTPAMFTYQTGGDYASDTNTIPQAQLELALEDPDIILAAPVYPVTSKGGHLDANGYRWLGCQFGKVMRQVLSLGKPWRPLHPNSAVVIGSDIEIAFHVPVPPLAWGRPCIGHGQPSMADQGFSVRDASGTIPIIGLAIVRPDRVRLILTRAPEGPARLLYATHSHHGRGGLHDSDRTAAVMSYVYDPATGHYPSANLPKLVGRPYPLMNWCVAFNIPLSPGTTPG